LTFLLDQGVKHSIEVSRLLHELLPAENKPGDGTGDTQEPFDAQEPFDDETFDEDEPLDDERDE
jgi:hypothetical protein